MENNLDNFDDLFRKRMSDFEPQGAKPDWGAFEQRWAEKEEEETAAFDRIIRERLRNVDDSSRREQHWKLMETRLDREFTLRGKLMRYRVMEAAAAILLIWTITNTLENHNDNELVTPNTKVAQQKNNYNKATNQPLSGQLIAPSGASSAEKESEKQQLVQNKHQLNSTISIKPTNFTTFDKTITSQNNAINTTTNAENPSQNLSKTGGTEGVFATTESNLLEAQNKNLGQNLSKTGGTEGVIARVASRETAVVEPLEPKFKDFDVRLTQEDMMYKTPIIKPLLAKAEKTASTRVAMYASATLDNTHNTIQSSVFSGESFDVQGNYGMGVNVAFQVDKNLEIETGLAYASKKYTPVQVRKVTGNFDRYVTTNIQNVRLNLVNLPIHLKYRFKHGKRWSFFALLGGSLNVAAQTSYDTELSLSTPNNERKISSQADSDRLPQDYKNGLLEGGMFKENHYLTADIGVGAEYKLTKRWSLFAQPTYMHQIGVKGIGPNKDRINTLAVHFGSKVTL